MRNGVDLERFHPVDQRSARKLLDLGDERILLSVGHLVERKGHHLAIEALTSLPQDFILVLAGSGPDLGSLKALAEAKGLTHRVRFVGQVANEQLKYLYSAADALVLCSSREGWANDAPGVDGMRNASRRNQYLGSARGHQYTLCWSIDARANLCRTC